MTGRAGRSPRRQFRRDVRARRVAGLRLGAMIVVPVVCAGTVVAALFVCAGTVVAALFVCAGTVVAALFV